MSQLPRVFSRSCARQAGRGERQRSANGRACAQSSLVLLLRRRHRTARLGWCCCCWGVLLLLGRTAAHVRARRHSPPRTPLPTHVQVEEARLVAVLGHHLGGAAGRGEGGSAGGERAWAGDGDTPSPAAPLPPPPRAAPTPPVPAPTRSQHLAATRRAARGACTTGLLPARKALLRMAEACIVGGSCCGVTSGGGKAGGGRVFRGDSGLRWVGGAAGRTSMCGAAVPHPPSSAVVLLLYTRPCPPPTPTHATCPGAGGRQQVQLHTSRPATASRTARRVRAAAAPPAARLAPPQTAPAGPPCRKGQAGPPCGGR